MSYTPFTRHLFLLAYLAEPHHDSAETTGAAWNNKNRLSEQIVETFNQKVRAEFVLERELSSSASIRAQRILETDKTDQNAHVLNQNQNPEYHASVLNAIYLVSKME